MVLIAHRGDPVHAAENTLASFREAASRGAKAVEMDLRRNPDGVWVVFHDKIPARMKSSRFLQLPGALAFCRSRRLDAYLDIKEPGGEESLLQAIRSHGKLSRTVLMAGSPAELRRWRRLLPHHPLFWVTGYRQGITARRLSEAKRLRLAGFFSYRMRVSPRAVERVHRAGLKIGVWTVRAAPELRRFHRMGVDAAMSEVWPPPRLT